MSLFKPRSAVGLSSSAGARATPSSKPKDVQRRIFLQTMRNVYPDSIQIFYVTDPEDENLLVLRPLSVLDKCPTVSDKVHM